MSHKVSVIVPVWNTEQFLEKCLDSILGQSLDDFELIIVDDGSPDNSWSIIEKYSKKYPEIIKSFKKENGGQGSARNLGLEHADGKYISFVDSDDYLDKDMLKEMYQQAEKNGDDIVICDMMDHYPDGKTIYYNCTKYYNIHEVTPSACNKIFRRETIGDIRFLSKKWYEDFNFTTKILFSNPKISVISKPFYICNCGHVSTMHNNNSKKNLDMIYVLDDLKSYLNDKGLFDDNIFSFLVFTHLLLTTINRVELQTSDDKRDTINKLVIYCRENISDYKSKPFYKNISRNKKIIANLNYLGLSSLSRFILNTNARLKR